MTRVHHPWPELQLEVALIRLPLIYINNLTLQLQRTNDSPLVHHLCPELELEAPQYAYLSSTFCKLTLHFKATDK